MEINALEGFGYSVLLIATGMLLNKMWDDLMPKGRVFTGTRVALGFLAISMGAGTWVALLLIKRTDDMTAMLLMMILAIMAFITAASLAAAVGFDHLRRRIAAIEKHQAPPANDEPTPTTSQAHVQ
jgi:hypothetical protein